MSEIRKVLDVMRAEIIDAHRLDNPSSRQYDARGHWLEQIVNILDELTVRVEAIEARHEQEDFGEWTTDAEAAWDGRGDGE